MTKNMLYLSLFFSVISLFYFLFVYFGLIRYIKLHVASVQPFIENYRKLEKNDKNRVVVCLSARGEELSKMGPTILSLLDQTVRVDEIVLFVPYSDIGKIPQELKPVLSVNGYSKPYSSLVSLICSILTEPEANTKIILLENNIIYGEELVERLVEKSKHDENKMVYASGKDMKKGLLVKPKFFEICTENYEQGEKLLKDNSIPSASINYWYSYKRL